MHVFRHNFDENSFAALLNAYFGLQTEHFASKNGVLSHKMRHQGKNN